MASSRANRDDVPRLDYDSDNDDNALDRLWGEPPETWSFDDLDWTYNAFDDSPASQHRQRDRQLPDPPHSSSATTNTASHGPLQPSSPPRHSIYRARASVHSPPNSVERLSHQRTRSPNRAGPSRRQTGQSGVNHGPASYTTAPGDPGSAGQSRSQPTAHSQRTHSGQLRPEHSENWLDSSTTGIDRSRALVFSQAMLEPISHSEQYNDGVEVDDWLSLEEEGEMVSRTPLSQRRSNTIDLTGGRSSPAPSPHGRRQRRTQQHATAAAASSSNSTPRSGRHAMPSLSNLLNDSSDSLDDEDDEAGGEPRPIEHLDLTGDDDIANSSLAQTIAAQQSSSEPTGPLRLGQRQCIICMERYTDMTTTHCGHIYCHECLTQALQTGEKNNVRGIGSCPVCRKPVNRNRVNQVIPISFMKRSAYVEKWWLKDGKRKDVKRKRE